MKTINSVLWLIFMISIFACKKTTEITSKEKNSMDTLVVQKEQSSYESAYDSIENAAINTTSLEGKRERIKNLFALRNGLIYPNYDTLIDLNYDSYKDYILGFYARSGTGLKNGNTVYLFNKKTNTYEEDSLLSDLPNASYYLEQKRITSFYIGHGGGGGNKLRWINNQWQSVKEFDVDYKGSEKVYWLIYYPLKQKKDSILLPYQMLPPKQLLESYVNDTKYSL